MVISMLIRGPVIIIGMKIFLIYSVYGCHGVSLSDAYLWSIASLMKVSCFWMYGCTMSSSWWNASSVILKKHWNAPSSNWVCIKFASAPSQPRSSSHFWNHTRCLCCSLRRRRRRRTMTAAAVANNRGLSIYPKNGAKNLETRRDNRPMT